MKDRLSLFTSLGSWCFTAIQTKELFQYISLILSIICTILTIIFTIWRWYRKASADGKITEEEVDELIDSVEKEVKKNDR